MILTMYDVPSEVEAVAMQSFLVYEAVEQQLVRLRLNRLGGILNA